MTAPHWMLMASGLDLDLVYPTPGKIVFANIAHSLAQINRFHGHARRPYSVAEHSLLVCDIAEREFGLDVHGRLAALMHDAHESITNDLSSPAKAVVGEGWARFEGRMERLVRACFALHTAFFAYGDALRQADLIALATERQQLMHLDGPIWETLVHVQPVSWVDLMAESRVRASWLDWRDAFSDRYHALDYQRAALMHGGVKPEATS